MARSHETALHLSLLLLAGFSSAFTLQNNPLVFSRQISLKTAAACKQGSLLQNCRHAPFPAALSRSARKSSEFMSSALPSSDSAIPSSDKLVLSGSTPMAGCIVNLIKNIVGSGVLCLAGSVAAFSDQPKMLVAALGIALGFAVIAAYCFALIARTCQMTGAKSYTEAWAKSIGANTAWLPNVIVIFKTWSACLIYSIIIGDLFNDLAITAGVSEVAGIAVTRTSIIVATHAFGLLPLCLLRSFSFLSYASLLGVGGILYTAAFMVLRLFEGSYLPGGEFFQALTAAGAGAAPVVVSSFDVKGTSLLKSVILISTLTSSYLCHYNAPKFLKELKEATTARFNTLTYTSFLGAFALNAVFMVSGFLLFGGASKGLILNNYATTDTLATISRGAIASSILLGYPLTFEGFRSAALELFRAPAAAQPVRDAIAVGFLLACGGSALVLRDLGAVVSFFGALLGSAVIYVLPSLMYRSARRAELAPGEDPGPDYRAAGALIPAGAGLGLLGAAVVVLKATTDILK